MSTNTKRTTAQLAVTFLAGLAFGSIVTLVLVPGVSWESCRKLGIETAARCFQLKQPAGTGYTAPRLSDADIDNLGLKVASSHRLVRVNGTHNIASPFKGPPSHDIDSAWESYWKVWLVSVDQGAFSASLPQHPSAAVRLRGGTHERRYLATLGATHQLHCLYNLFRASYLDAYPDERAEYERDPRHWHKRVDHCVDILRPKLECDRDTTLVTYNWVRGKGSPTANFNVAPTCANWSSMERWALQHQVKDVPRKPADAVELPEIP